MRTVNLTNDVSFGYIVSLYYALTENVDPAILATHYCDSFIHKNLYESLIDCAKTFKKVKRMHNLRSDIYCLEMEDHNFIFISSQSRDHVAVTAYGTEKFVVDLTAKLGKKAKEKTTIEWAYMTSNGIGRADIEITHVNQVHPEYYPFMDGGPVEYFDRYMASDSPILILIGEPGTGKTSFIRAMLDRHTMRAGVTFDEEIMKRDSYYISYLTSKYQDMLVIEDADILLTSRKSDQNKTMAKLLNISDGLVKLVNKKIIFTTNLTNVKDIDPALMRPGRCFDVLHFRQLNFDEAVAVCKRAGKEPVTNPRETYTLSEIFNGQITTSAPTKRIGFAA